MKDKLNRASRIAILDCMKVRKNEKVLIISDSNKHKIGYSLYTTSKNLGFYTIFVEIPVGKINGEEPPPEIAELMKSFDVIFCPTTKSLTHTNARRNASALGARVATFPGITEDIMIRGMNADYKKIAALSVKLKGILEKGERIRVQTKLGTDISFSIKGRTAYASKGLFHKKGESGNLPTGETFLAPIEGTSNGKIVVDGSFAGIGKIVDKPIVIEVKEGFAYKITGGKEAAELNKMIKKVGNNGRNIAEFGIGTNGSAKLSGIILEDEKVLGTVHIALGNNKSMGGNVDVPLHVDGVILKPDVYLDDKPLMKQGKLISINK